MSSILAQAFSSRLFRGTYADEKPAVDLEIKGSEQERKRLTSLVNRVAKSSPFGRSILEAAAADGYSLSFEMQLSSFGFCERDRKAIVLDPKVSDRRLVSVLAHEGRHAQQFSNGADENFGKRTVKSSLMYFRAMEADAEAAASVTCLEMKSAGDAEPWDKFKTAAPYVAGKLHFFEKMPNVHAASGMLMTAFEGWYEDPMIKEAYEISYLLRPMKDAMKRKSYDDLPFDREEKSADIVRLICRGPQGCYFEGRPDVLEDPDKLDMASMTVSQAGHFFAVRQMHTGKEPDTSFHNLSIRRSPDSVLGAPLYCGGNFYSVRAARPPREPQAGILKALAARQKGK